MRPAKNALHVLHGGLVSGALTGPKRGEGGYLCLQRVLLHAQIDVFRRTTHYAPLWKSDRPASGGRPKATGVSLRLTGAASDPGAGRALTCVKSRFSSGSSDRVLAGSISLNGEGGGEQRADEEAIYEYKKRLSILLRSPVAEYERRLHRLLREPFLCQ